MHNHDDKYLSRPGFEPGTPGYKPQSIRMSHRAGRSGVEYETWTIMFIRMIHFCYYFHTNSVLRLILLRRGSDVEFHVINLADFLLK